MTKGKAQRNCEQECRQHRNENEVEYGEAIFRRAADISLKDTKVGCCKLHLQQCCCCIRSTQLTPQAVVHFVTQLAKAHMQTITD